MCLLNNTTHRYIPFSAGPRKCIGDQFALMEAQVAMIVLLREIQLSLVPDQKIEMTTGATIHTKDGLFVTASKRGGGANGGGEAEAQATPPSAEAGEEVLTQQAVE